MRSVLRFIGAVALHTTAAGHRKPGQVLHSDIHGRPTRGIHWMSECKNLTPDSPDSQTGGCNAAADRDRLARRRVLARPGGGGVRPGPVKIGFLAPLSGAIAQAGRTCTAAASFFWEESGWQIAGRKLESPSRDKQGLPATRSPRRGSSSSPTMSTCWRGHPVQTSPTRSCVHRGPGHSDHLPDQLADELTTQSAPSGSSAPGFSAGGTCIPSASTRRRRSGYRKIAMSPSTTLRLGDRRRVPEDLRGQRRQSPDDWVPSTCRLRALHRPDPEGCRRRVRAGPRTMDSAVRQAVGGSGLKVPLIAGGTTATEHVLPQSATSRSGVISAHHYSAALDTPATGASARPSRRSTTACRRSTRRNCYTGARVVAEAARGRGRSRGRPAPPSWLRSAPSRSATRRAGRSRWTPYGNPTQNIYIRKVERVGENSRTPSSTPYPAVSQFWKYNPRSS